MLSPEILKVFETVPDLYLILSPELVILTASDAYLEATFTRREEITGKFLFDVFPDNPAATDAHAVANLRDSLEEVLRTGKPHRMALQHYDVPHQGQLNNGFVEKYWLPIITPVLDLNGAVSYIIHKVEDATEKVKAELRLQQEHHRLLDSQAIGQVGSFEWDFRTNAVYWSDEMYRMHGLDPQSEAITLERVLTFIHPDDIPLVKARIREWQQEPRAGTIVHRMLRPDGAVRVLERTVRSFGDENGRVTHISGTARDITERVNAEQELKAQANFIRHITEMVPDIISVTELPSRNLLYCNNENLAMHGFNWEELLRMNVEERRQLIDPKDLLALNAYFGSFTATTADQEVHSLEYSAKNRQTEWQTFFARGKVFERNHDGSVHSILNVIQNITAQKKAEQELHYLKDALAQRATEKYLTLFNSIDQGFCVIEVLFEENNEATDYRFLEINPAFGAQTGLQNVAGKTMKSLAPDHEEHWFRIYGEVARTGISRHFEERAEALGRWYNVYAFRIGDPQEHHVAVLFSDITARKKHEQQQSFLLQLADQVNSLTRVPEIEAVTAEGLGRFLGVAQCLYGELFPRVFCVDRDWTDGTLESLAGCRRIGDLGELFELYLAGQTVVVNDTWKDLRIAGQADVFAGSDPMRSFIAVPVMKQERCVAILFVNHSKPRQWAQSEVELVREVAESTWVSVQRARAEAALQESEEKYRSLFNSIDEGFVISELLYDTAGKPVDLLVLETNPSFERLMRTQSPSAGKRAKEIFPDVEQAWFEAYHQVILTGEALRLESYLAPLDSWFELYISRLGGAGSRRFAIVFQDITERKIAEKALWESESRFRNLVEAHSQAVWEIDAAGHLVVESPSWRVFTGQNFQEMAGLGWSKAIHPDDRDYAMNLWQEAIHSGQDVDAEFRIRDAAGNYRWTNVRATPIRDQHGKVLKWAGMNIDIHDRKMAEVALLRSEERLKSAISIQTAGVLFVDLEGNIYDTNPGFERMSGYRRDDFVSGRVSLESLTPPEYMMATLLSRAELVAKGQNTPYEKELVRPDGTRWWGLFAGKRLSEKEYVKFVIDITERKKAEQLLRDFNAQLEQQVAERTRELVEMRLNQQKELLLAILDAQEEERRRISESLHNGIGQILYATKMSLDQVSKIVPKTDLKLTENLLSEAIAETRRVSHELVPLILQDFGLAEGLSDLCRRFQQTDLLLSCSVTGLPVRLESYLEVAIYRICQELLNNVVKHAEATEATVTVTRNGSEIVLEVLDNGIGLTGKTAKKNGIGLRTIADRVKLLNGTLEIMNPASGNGTQIIIRIPIEK